MLHHTTFASFVLVFALSFPIDILALSCQRATQWSFVARRPQYGNILEFEAFQIIVGAVTSQPLLHNEIGLSQDLVNTGALMLDCGEDGTQVFIFI